MLKIRLQRTGRTNDPSFRVIVVEHTESAKTRSFVEQVGTYNPRTKEKNLVADRIKYWLSVGAKASGTVHNMLITTGITSGKKINVLPRKSPPKSADAEGTPEVKEGDGDTGTAATAPAATASDDKGEATEPAALAVEVAAGVDAGSEAASA